MNGSDEIDPADVDRVWTLPAEVAAAELDYTLKLGELSGESPDEDEAEAERLRLALLEQYDRHDVPESERVVECRRDMQDLQGGL